ncbi:ABC transporter substrate-binding protein [Amycolatopsis sp. NPDC004378]
MAAVLGLTGCSALGGSGEEPPSSAGALESASLRVSIISTVDLAPFWLAQEAGYFGAEGLDVDVEVAPSGDKSMTKAISGDADIALTTYTLLFVAKAGGATDLKLVADATSASAQSNQIVTVPNSPVKTIQDLAGKRVAISSKNAASDILTRSVMKEHNIDTGTVQWIQMPLPNMAAALRSEEIDAAYQPEPFLTLAAKSIGAIPVADAASGATRDFPITGYTATAKWVESHPKTMAAFQRAMLRATREAAADRSKVENLVVKHAKVQPDIAALMTLPNFTSILDARRIQRVPDLLRSLGVLDAKVDVAPMIAPQPRG